MISKLEYEITVADHIAKLERFAASSPVGRTFTWFAYFTIIGLAWLSAILFYVKQGQQNYAYVFSGAFALALTLTLPALYQWYQSSFWASIFTPTAVQGLVGRKVLELHPDFVEEIGERLTLRAKWRDVERIVSDAHRTWLILSPLQSIVIPDSAFRDDTERAKFVQHCQARIDSQRVTDS